MIVEDHQALREGLELMLANGGCDVLAAAGSVADGEEAIRRLRPDVALIDIRLPDGSGIDLTRALVAEMDRLQVILYTGHADSGLLYDGLDSGARGYALKTGSMEELLTAIRAVAAGDAYVDPRLARVLLSPQATARVPALSPREREVLHLMAEGLTAEAIGDRLGVSVETVRTHVRNTIRKLEARNRVHAIAIALERGEIRLDPAGDGR